MDNEDPKKISYAMNEATAKKHLKLAKENSTKALALMKYYCCSDRQLHYRDQIIELLAEYVTNTKFYATFMDNTLASDSTIENKKTGENQIVIPEMQYGILHSYIMVTATCETELIGYGISMYSH
tara:strand:+ start:1313 stop:1687 length:375 start_codon:yes stop_codon:yes gene_type:complete